jgi:GDP-4-dehydro-6-deoxy-D-mannose reductase
MTQPHHVWAAVADARPDLVIHLAAQASVAASWADPAQTLLTNAGATIHLLEALRATAPNARILLIGSGEAYGAVRAEENPIAEDHPLQPVNPYAVAKATLDMLGYQNFAAYGLAVCRLRPFNSFGPRQSPAFVVASFARQIAAIEAGAAEPVLHVGNLEALRDFLPVEDVAQAYLAVAERGHPGAAYNVGSGQGRTIKSILERLLSWARVPIDVRADASRLRPADVPALVADTTRLRTHTGWAPLADFDEALRRTLEYWRGQR